MYKYSLIFLTLLLVYSCKKESNQNKIKASNNETVKNHFSSFKKITSEHSKIKFNNKIIDDISTKENLFDFDFFFNGAGVGIEDLNNDGLKDIFFCGNQVQNKLYINKGNLVFEDVSKTANINYNKKWSNGVTFVDINNDGWMDIYVSQGGPKNANERNNLLYINQKDLTFKEQATNYGLNDTGISTQSSFFDLDNDGDLDCIVMNENDYYGLDPISFFKILSDEEKLIKNCSHIYENTNGKFKAITKKAGLLKPTFGLGLCVSDVNNDGWLDIYIANDYYVPDALYINNKNGTFTDQIKSYTNQVSFYGMGVDIADINNDNLKDIYVLDMASNDHIRSKTLMSSMNVSKFNLLTENLELQHQYMYNSLQLNMGNNKFHNISQATGLSKTDWSWAGLIFDFDNDQHEDIYVTNGYRKYALDNDIRTNIFKAKKYYKGNVPLEIKNNIYNSLPSEKLPNVLFNNKGNLNFEDVTSLSDVNTPSFSNGAAYSDLDNDGDLDLVVNNIDDEAFLFKNQTNENTKSNYLKVNTKGRTSEDFAKITIIYDTKTKTKEAKRVRGYMSSVDKTIHFGLGSVSSIDTLRVTWLSGKQQELYNIKANSTVYLNEDNATNTGKDRQKKKYSFKKINNLISFHHTEDNYDDFEKEGLLPYKQSTLGPSITIGDINGDKIEDLYIGGAKDQAGQLFIQNKTGFNKIDSPTFESDSNHEDMESIFFDFDNDGDNDLYVVSGGNNFKENSIYLKDRLYINNGNTTFTKHQLSKQLPAISGKTISKIDFDNDGDFDLIIGNRNQQQKYPLFEKSVIYENINGTLKNVTEKVAKEFESFGMVNKVISTDFNNDGWEDFIAIGEWTHIGIFKNENGIFKDISNNNMLNNEKGWWFSIIETDVNNDGLKDYLVGNVGLNIKYKSTKEKPLKIFAADLDNNGSHDIVLSYKYNDMQVPLRGLDCSSLQMPFIKEKITSFSEFANSSLKDIYGNALNTAHQKDVNQFKSILLINKGNDRFIKKELPFFAQIIPFLDLDAFDFNNDGFEDIIAVGNIYNTEVETPRLDNNYGLVLTSNRKDGYDILSPDKTGFYINGNSKFVKKIKHKNLNKDLIIIGYNNSVLETFELDR